MLSKGEIEVLKKLFEEVIQTKEKTDIRLKINKQVAEYLLSCINSSEQLETSNKKLIEKLEEVIKKNNEFEFMPLQVEKAYNNYYKLGKMDLAQEILKIAKGEKK